MLLTAGIVLHCIALAQLYWPLSSPALLPRRRRRTLSTTDVTDETESLADMDDSEFSSDEDDIDNQVCVQLRQRIYKVSRNHHTF